MGRMLEGGCLCAAVRYVAEGDPLNVRICHCRLCQKAIGASFNARALFRREAVTISGPVVRYPSSPELMRGFCQTCGTTLFSERQADGLIGLTLGSMDDPAQCPPPATQIWTSRRQEWLADAELLPKYAEAAPA